MDSEEPTTDPSSPAEPQSRPAEAPRDEGGGGGLKRCFKIAILGLIGLLVFAGLLSHGDSASHQPAEEDYGRLSGD